MHGPPLPLHRRQCLALMAAGVWPVARAQARLRAAWDDYPPYQQAPASKELGPSGLDILLAERIAQRAGLGLQWVHMPWARQLLSLQEGSLDLALAASRVPEREAYALWTQAYRPERAALLALRPPAQPIGKLTALRGVRIGIIRGTSYPGEMALAQRDAGFQAQLVQLRHVEQGLRMLREGRLDFVIDDPAALNHLTRRDGHAPLVVARWLMRAEASLMLSRKAEAARPGLLATLDAAISALRADGGLRAPLKDYPDLLDA